MVTLPKGHGNAESLVSRYNFALTCLGRFSSSGLELNDLFNQAKILVKETLEVEYFNVWLIMSDGISLRQLNSDTTDYITANLPNSGIFSLINKQSIQALLTNKYLTVFNKNSLDKSFNTPVCPVPKDSISNVQVPILGGGNLLGFIEVSSTSPRQFSSDVIHFLQSVSHILSAAIERKRSEDLVLSQHQVLEQIAMGVDLQKIFNSLCVLMERLLPGSYCSVLVVDAEQQCLRSGAAPTLPQKYVDGINGLMIGGCSGSCGTAAYRGKPVFVQILPYYQTSGKRNGTRFVN
ncbi:MAG: GAF domain-containing protein [Leptolyngbyaceae bacterium]|nr:GAF domain-containing protein [Leptolyngbyaceae bacterium]